MTCKRRSDAQPWEGEGRGRGRPQEQNLPTVSAGQKETRFSKKKRGSTDVRSKPKNKKVWTTKREFTSHHGAGGSGGSNRREGREAFR